MGPRRRGNKRGRGRGRGRGRSQTQTAEPIELPPLSLCTPPDTPESPLPELGAPECCDNITYVSSACEVDVVRNTVSATEIDTSMETKANEVKVQVEAVETICMESAAGVSSVIDSVCMNMDRNKTEEVISKDPITFLMLRDQKLAGKPIEKILKRQKKELKHSGVKKKVRKSLGSFLGDKVKYNMEEMVAEVKLGMKEGQDEKQFCSLGSFIQPQPYRGKVIMSMNSAQLTGFRLHHGSALHLTLPSNRQAELQKETPSFKVPAAPVKRQGKRKSWMVCE